MKILYIIVIIAVIVIIYLLKSKFNSSSDNKTTNIDITDEDIKEQVKQNNKIEAIKMYRSLYKVDLLEAKNAIEKMMNEI